MACGFRSKIEINNYYNRVASNLENLEKLMFFFKKKENIEKSGEISKNDKQTNDNKSGKAKECFFVRLNQFHLSLSNWYTLTCLR